MFAHDEQVFDLLRGEFHGGVLLLRRFGRARRIARSCCRGSGRRDLAVALAALEQCPNLIGDLLGLPRGKHAYNDTRDVMRSVGWLPTIAVFTILEARVL